MEKVEKLLLLVVLGAAMIIMAVMSFGSKEPGTPPGGDLNGQTALSGSTDSTGSAKTPAIPEVTDPNRGTDSGYGTQVLGTQSIDDLGVVQDGPQLVKRDQGVVSKGDDLAGKPGLNAENGSAGVVNPLAPGGKSVDPSLTPPPVSPDLGTADLTLKPGEDPGIWIYMVKPNESMGGISERITGSQSNMHEIASFNEGMDLDRIRPGQEIQIPGYLIKGKDSKAGSGFARPASIKSGRQPVPGLIQPVRISGPTAGVSNSSKTATPRNASASRVVKTEEHIIRKGETLWAIAKRRVGDRKAMAYVRQIQDLNPNLDPANLQEKEHILLPAR